MWKTVLAGTTALAIAGSSLVYAQQRSDTQNHQRWQPTQEDMQAFAAARIAALKAGLMLNTDQEKNWPAFESALKNLAQYRRQERQTRHNEQPTTDPTERLRRAAQRLSGFGAALKQLADAQQPLYDSLTDAQKRRFGILAHMLKPHHWRHFARMYEQHHRRMGRMGEGMHEGMMRGHASMGDEERGGMGRWRGPQRFGNEGADEQRPQLEAPTTNGDDQPGDDQL